MKTYSLADTPKAPKNARLFDKLNRGEYVPAKLPEHIASRFVQINAMPTSRPKPQ